MISRLSAFAATFALVATGALAFTVHAQQQVATPVVAAKPVRIIALPNVVVIGHRTERTTH